MRKLIISFIVSCFLASFLTSGIMDIAFCPYSYPPYFVFINDPEFNDPSAWTSIISPHDRGDGFVQFNNGMLRLKSVSDETNILGYASEYTYSQVTQGLRAHGDGQCEPFRIGETYSDSTLQNDYVEFQIYPDASTGEIPLDTYWLDVRTRIIERTILHEAVTFDCDPLFLPWTGLVIGFECQFQYYDEDQEEWVWSDYDNPNYYDRPSARWYLDVHLGMMTGHWGIADYWANPTWLLGQDTMVGTACKYDYDIHTGVNYLHTMDEGIWYNLHYDFGKILNEGVFATDDWLPFWTHIGIPPEVDPQFGDFRYIRIKAITVACETAGCIIEAEFDHVRLYTNTDFTWDLDVEAIVHDGRCDGKEPQTTIYLNGHIHGCTPRTFSLRDTHTLGVRDDIYIRTNPLSGWKCYYSFWYWEYNDGSNQTTYSNPMNIHIDDDPPYPYVAHYEYVSEEWTGAPSSGGGGGGGGWLKIFSLVGSDYGCMTDVNKTGRIDNHLFVDLRTTFGNVNGSINVDVYTEHERIDIESTGIEQICLDLGEIWTVHGRNQYFNPFSYKVDDITAWINIDNVTSCEIIFIDVPNVLSIKKNQINMEKGEFWDYVDGDLHLYMTFGDPEISIDFETTFSITMEMFEIFVIVSMVSICVVMIKKWKFSNGS